MDLLHQLGNLFLSAVPTAIVVFLFYLFLRWAFFRPLLQVMSKRQGLTEGARREAESIAGATQEKKRAYQEALRKGRAAIFAEQEAVRRVALEERGKIVRRARVQANEQVQAAKARLAGEIESVKSTLDASTQELAEEVARAVLEPAGRAQ
jgi:F-type H+-transporting ATPase subunit b